jgi:phospholipid/cholesterol/gamma-HCH transport system substrate-binding protein
MKTVFRENALEALIGLLVVLLAAWFVWFAWMKTGGGARSGAIHVVAMFPNSSGVNVGTDVRVAGLKVGTVTDQTLDPASYQVKVTLAIDPKVKLPADSSAAITSEGLLGSTYVALLPGGAPDPLKEGDVITDTQGSIDLMSLVGQFINRAPSGSDGGGASTESAAP